MNHNLLEVYKQKWVISMDQLQNQAVHPSKSTKKENTITDLAFTNLKIEQDKWATLRSLNVEEIANVWNDAPTKVKILSDNKLGDQKLAILSKDTFEGMYRVIEDLQSGQMGLAIGIRTVGEHLGILRDLLSQKIDEKDLTELAPLKKLSELAFNVVAEIQSKVIVFGNKTKLEPSPLSEDEAKELDYEE
jgi:hypothetical protein